MASVRYHEFHLGSIGNQIGFWFHGNCELGPGCVACLFRGTRNLDSTFVDRRRRQKRRVAVHFGYTRRMCLRWVGVHAVPSRQRWRRSHVLGSPMGRQHNRRGVGGWHLRVASVGERNFAHLFHLHVWGRWTKTCLR